ncbi:MAG: hypothetical protein ACHP8A_04735 [Terriglobales bacterium]|jgi:hypothetical protein|nr:hypothetical protein [Terriglobales bacterium]
MEPNNQDDLASRLLNAGLQHYSATEPQPGLEQRLLAHVRLEQKQRTSVLFYWWLVPSGVVVLAIVSAALFVDRRSETVSSTIVASSQLHPAARPSLVSLGPTDLTHVAPPRSVINPRASRPVHSEKPVRREPRLEQFPSPRPLSKEEELLRAFVTEAPKEELVMAAAMTKGEDLQIKSLEIPSLEGDGLVARSNEKDH